MLCNSLSNQKGQVYIILAAELDWETELFNYMLGFVDINYEGQACVYNNWFINDLKTRCTGTTQHKVLQSLHLVIN